MNEKSIESSLTIKLLNGSYLIMRHCVEGSLEMNVIEFKIQPMIISMVEFDIILGMNWSMANHVTINRWQKKVKIARPGGQEVVFFMQGRKVPLINELKAQKCLKIKCNAYQTLLDVALPDDYKV